MGNHQKRLSRYGIRGKGWTKLDPLRKKSKETEIFNTFLFTTWMKGSIIAKSMILDTTEIKFKASITKNITFEEN